MLYCAKHLGHVPRPGAPLFRLGGAAFPIDAMNQRDTLRWHLLRPGMLGLDTGGQLSDRGNEIFFPRIRREPLFR